MKTYKITFHLQTPISFIDVPTFDGLLAYCFAKEVKQDKFYQKLSYTKDELIDFRKLPLGRHKKGYFYASSMQFDKGLEYIEKWRKRWDNQNDYKSDFKKAKRKIAINKAEFKSYDMPIPLNVIPKVWFYFKSSEIEEVIKLLHRQLVGIGKKISQGNGIIRTFEVEETKFNFDSIFRPIPKKFVTSDMMLNTNNKVVIAYCGWKPPYWLPENMTDCVK